MTRAALLALFLATPAMAQPCAPAEEMLGKLARDYHELPSGIGLSKRGDAIVLYTSPDGRTFTLLRVTSEGIACLIEAGDSWSGEGVEVGEPS